MRGGLRHGGVDGALVVLVGGEEVVGAREDKVQRIRVGPGAREPRLELVDLAQRAGGHSVGETEPNGGEIVSARRRPRPGVAGHRHAEDAGRVLGQQGPVGEALAHRSRRRQAPVGGVGGHLGGEAARVDVAVAEHDEPRDRLGRDRGGEGGREGQDGQ